MKLDSLAWQYAYISEGLNITNLLKPLIYALLGYLAISMQPLFIIIAGLLYTVAIYAVGMWAWKSGFMKARQEVANLNNKFVYEMRRYNSQKRKIYKE